MSIRAPSRQPHATHSFVNVLERRCLLAGGPTALHDDFLTDRYTISLDPEVVSELHSSGLHTAVSAALDASQGLVTLREFLSAEQFVSVTSQPGSTFDEVRSAVDDIPGFVDLLRVPTVYCTDTLVDASDASQGYNEPSRGRETGDAALPLRVQNSAGVVEKPGIDGHAGTAAVEAGVAVDRPAVEGSKRNDLGAPVGNRVIFGSRVNDRFRAGDGVRDSIDGRSATNLLDDLISAK